VALLRVGGQAGILDERRPGDDLEDARRWRGCLGAQIARRTDLNVARVRQDVARLRVDEDDGGFGEFVGGEDRLGRPLQVRVDSEAGDPSLGQWRARPEIVEPDLAEVESTERRQRRRRWTLGNGRERFVDGCGVGDAAPRTKGERDEYGERDGDE